MADTVPSFDSSRFSTDAYARRIDKPWGYELHLVPEGLPYMAKLIHVKAGCRLSLQVHDEKQESWTALGGPAKVIWEDASGALVETTLAPGVGYTCQVGQKHRLAAGQEGDAEFFEVSTPESGTTYRLEDDYARPDETPAQRLRERAVGV